MGKKRKLTEGFIRMDEGPNSRVGSCHISKPTVACAQRLSSLFGNKKAALTVVGKETRVNFYF